MPRVSNGRLCRGIIKFWGFPAMALIAALTGVQSQAAVPSPTGFDLALAPTARLLDAWWTPDYYDVLYDEMCDNPHLRVRARNKPAIRIDNKGNSAAPITEFTLEINSGPYFFGTGDFDTDAFTDYVRKTIYTDPGVTITGSSVSADKRKLTVTFDGFEADKTAIFNVDLDAPNGDFPFPDYRNVLYGAPLSQGDPATTPASFTLKYVDGASAVPNEKLISGNFQVQLDAQGNPEVPDFQNADIRPYVEVDRMEIIEFEIPEPSSAALAAVCGMALAAIRRRPRG